MEMYHMSFVGDELLQKSLHTVMLLVRFLFSSRKRSCTGICQIYSCGSHTLGA